MPFVAIVGVSPDSAEAANAHMREGAPAFKAGSTHTFIRFYACAGRRDPTLTTAPELRRALGGAIHPSPEPPSYGVCWADL